MNELKTFAFEAAPVRTVSIDGEPWFVARDVCEVLGYANASDAITRHCKGVAKRDTLTEGGPQEMTIIPERDLYRLVMRSKLPSAERFEEWVVGTVLPTIRKTGSYVRGEEAFDVTTDAGLAAATVHVMAALQAKADGYKAQYEAAKPKADAFMVLEEATGSMTVTNAAKALGANRNKLYDFLEAKRWVTRGPNRQPTATALRTGRMDVRTHTDPRGRVHTTPVVRPPRA